MTTQWPRSNLEQELATRELEKLVARLTHTRQSLVIHSYTEPNRQQWEAQYRTTLSGEPPIPPGLRLCWHDMRNNIIRQYGTTFDLQNGTRSSGAIYETIRNQTGSAIRLIGIVNVDGRISSSVNQHPNIVIGSNIVTHKRRGLLMLEMMFRFRHNFVNDGTRLWLNFGDTIVEPEMVSSSDNDVSRMYGRGNAGVLSSAQAFDNTFPQESELLLMPESPDAANGATVFPDMLIHMRIMNPFGNVNASSGRDFGFRSNNVGFGAVYHFPNNYGLPSANAGIITNFMVHRLHPVKLGKDWRIYFREQTANTRVTPVGGDGWVYGYYNQAVSESQEFDGVI